MSQRKRSASLILGLGCELLDGLDHTPEVPISSKQFIVIAIKTGRMGRIRKFDPIPWTQLPILNMWVPGLWVFMAQARELISRPCNGEFAGCTDFQADRSPWAWVWSGPG